MLKYYELRAFRGTREVREAAPYVTTLDLDEKFGLATLLNRHLIAVCERAGARTSDAHMFHLEVREMDDRMRPLDNSVFRWALPIDGAEVPRWL